MPSTATVIDVTDATFAAVVLEASRTRPVVVDFWAPWCGPCRVLGPMIERIAAEHGEDVALVKLNTDENPRTATQYRIQGIPAVKAFRDGKLVSEFTGAVPEPQVRAFFAKLAPTAAEKAAKAAAALAPVDPEAAEASFRALLKEAPGAADAIVGLAAILLRRGETEGILIMRVAPPEDAALVLLEGLFVKAPGRPDRASTSRRMCSCPALNELQLFTELMRNPSALYSETYRVSRSIRVGKLRLV